MTRRTFLAAAASAATAAIARGRPASRADDFDGLGDDAPLSFRPHPQAGAFRAQRDPDRPILAYYGGIGLRRTPEGRWEGYAQTGEADVRYLVRRLRENGVTRAYASFQEEEYPSTVAPTPPDGTPDYIALFCELAHEAGIEVYGDIACFANFVSKCRDFTRENPHTFTRDVDDRPDEHMLSPAYPEVRRFKRRLLAEYVQNYPVDGLALDFIRYPFYGQDFRTGFGRHGYDRPALRSFARAHDLDLDHRPPVDDRRWIRHKSRYVNRFIREVRSDLASAGVKLPIAAFNSGRFGSDDAFRTVHQDWKAWEAERLVDEHAPMFLMSLGMETLESATGELLSLRDASGSSTVMGPIFLSEGFDLDSGERPSPEMVLEAARRQIRLGCNGLWFCRPVEIEVFDLWPTVREIAHWSLATIRRGG